jgi:hypothetical protein
MIQVDNLIWTKRGYDIGLSKPFPEVIFVPERFDFITVKYRGENAVIVDESGYVVSGTKHKEMVYHYKEADFEQCRLCGSGFQKKAHHQVFCSSMCKERYRRA